MVADNYEMLRAVTMDIVMWTAVYGQCTDVFHATRRSYACPSLAFKSCHVVISGPLWYTAEPVQQVCVYP